MKPIVKFQGGKTRELKHILPMLPKGERLVEAFVGGGAVSFAVGGNVWINDTNPHLINLYRQVAGNRFDELLSLVEAAKQMEHDELEQEFYKARDIINNGHPDAVVWAFSYILVRQLCFSGMERHNKQGAFNVPFGHYQRFACRLSQEHHTHLSQALITHGTALDVIKNVSDGDVLFLDPPYLDRAGYFNGDGGTLHIDLHEALMETQVPWLLIHSEHEFYRDAYGDFIVSVEDFTYGQKWRGDYDGAKTKHLYISNQELMANV